MKPIILDKIIYINLKEGKCNEGATKVSVGALAPIAN